MSQDYEGDTELILYNTDEDYPIQINHRPANVRIVNCGKDQVTGKPYTNVGAIRRDAIKHASGDLHITFDDDDVYLPWFIRQGVDGLLKTGRKAWKPFRSFFKTNSRVDLVKNTLEASVIVQMQEMTFGLSTGSEGLSWYTRLRDQGELNENETDSIPAYAFDWSDPFNLAPHRQSGAIDRPNNFEEHKAATKDKHTRPIGLIDLQPHYKPFYDYLRQHPDQFNREYYERYALPYLK
jgi:hypothetical protein